ncbi:MAG: YgiT-type zinc finger protein [Spirochaetes bacterium]|nr:MAG: YgiT-type zinc finger protein [Spirochaetota bacterium]
MECSCGGVLIEGRSTYRKGSENFFFTLENIPAFQCMRCGKVLFTDEVVEKIRKLEQRLERDANEIVTGKPSVRLGDY